MSKTIDEKVVEMRFDNKQFESNVSQSMSTLDKLKRSLNLTDAAKGLEGVSSAAKSVDMSSLSDGVHTVGLKFNALYTMADQALRNITNSAMYYGKRIVSALTIDPVKTGFNEYELKMGSVQTIMASTGESLESVNDYLEELNTYADKTIYSFSDMTSNIGKFTNAGVGLKDAVSAIKGVSNVAAVSGANASDASRAMYNFAQALSAGYVKLIDWKSIENANMATVEFKEQLLETAVSLGTVTKEADGTYKTLKGNTFSATKNFNEVLQDQWMTTDVLVKTLGKYSDETTDIGKKAFSAAQDVKTLSQLFDTLKEAAQSGWSQTWEIIVGDFEEAKKFLTEVNEIASGILDASANARNDMLENWKIMGGREDLIQSLRNSIEAISSIIKPIKEAFRDIFPPMTAEKLFAFTQGLKNLTAKLIISDKTAENIKRTFKGLFAVIDILVTFVKAVASGIFKLLGNITSLGEGIINVTGSIGNWINKLRDGVKESNIFAKTIGKITDFLQKAIDKIKEFISFLKGKFVSPGFVGFLNVMSKIWDIIKIIGEKIVGVISSIGKALANVFRNGGINGIIDIINGGLLTAILFKIKNFTDGFADGFKEIGKIGKNVIEILDAVRGCFEAYQQNLKAKTLLTIASAIAILAASILVVSLIDPNKIWSSLEAITVLFTDLMASMAVFNKIGGDYKHPLKAATVMISASLAILVLASALKKIASIDTEDLMKSMVGIAGLSAIIVAIAKAMSSNEKAIIKGATQMVIFAVAIKILASVCKDLSGLSWGELAIGLAGVAILMTEISLFLRTAKFSFKTISTAKGIVILSAAIKILASACKDFGNMQWNEIVKGLSSIGILLGELAIFTKLSSGAKHVVSTGIALVLIASSMKILVSAIKDISSLNLDEIKKGLITLSASLAAIAIAVNLIPKNLFGIGVGLVLVSSALNILSLAVIKMGSMSWESIVKGLVALGGSIGILAIGLNAMKGTLLGSAALVVAAGALTILTPCLLILGNMSLESIGKSLLTIAGVFVILGLAGIVLAPLIPVILGLSAALLILGIGVTAIGAGLTLISAGITALSVALSAGAAAIVTSLTMILVGILNLIPLLLQKIGEGIIAFCEVIANSAKSIGAAIEAVIVSVLNVLLNCAPKIADTLLTLLVSVLTSLVEYTPKIVGLLMDFLVNVINSLAEKLPALIEAGINLIIAFIDGLADAIVNCSEKLRDAFIKLFKSVIESILIMLGIHSPSTVFKDIGSNMILGLIEGIKGKITSVKNAAVNCVKGVVDKVKSFLGINSPSKLFAEIGKYSDLGMIKGLKEYSSKVSKASENIGKVASNGMSKAMSNINFIDDIDSQPTIRPVLDLSDVSAGAKSINGMLNMTPSVGVMANIGSISSMMNKRQNGVNNDVVSAIDDLRKDLRKVGNTTYTINGITYDDGSNISSAIKTIIQAAKVERRV